MMTCLAKAASALARVIPGLSARWHNCEMSHIIGAGTLPRLAIIASALFASLLAGGTAAMAAPVTYFSAATENWLYTDITGANTTIDADHANSWLITVSAGQTIDLHGGNFTIKTGGSATADIILDLYACPYKCGTPVASSTVLKGNVTGQYTPTLFSFGSAYTMSGGAAGKTYFAILRSSTGTSGTAQYF